MFKVSATIAGALALVALIVWFGGQSIGAEVWQAGWAIPGNIIIHLGQLFCAACAWRLLVGDRSRSVAAFLRLRLIREGVNSLLPVAQIGGPLVAVRVMIAEGFNGAVAGAGTTFDLTVEAAMQLVFTLLGLVLLSHLGLAPDWVPWVEGGLTTGMALLLAFVVAQRAGLMRLLEGFLNRLQVLFPRLSFDSLRGLHAELLRLQRDPVVLVKAALLQLLSWSGGSFEVYLGLMAMGHPVSLAQAFIIECLGMAARSAGFAVPGALGVQEGGFILVGGLFGVAPDLALALSMLKRLRELTIGAVGVALWQWAEIRRWLNI
jgi:putative membrane protein